MNARALAWIRSIEGGFSDNPNDSGGPTYAGLTVPALVGLDVNHDGVLDFDVDRDGDVDADDIRALFVMPEPERSAKVAEFYERVWIQVASGLAWPADLLAFDGAVHSGPVVGIVLLQRALDVTADGLVGPNTRLAATLADPADLARAYQAERGELFRQICNRRPKDRGFFLGWANRVAWLRAEVLRGES